MADPQPQAVPDAVDREDLRQGSFARKSRRAAIFLHPGNAAGRSRPAHARRADRGERLRMRPHHNRDRESRRQDAVPGRGRAGGIFQIDGVPLSDIQPHHRHTLPERAVPLYARDDRRRHHAGGVPAGASGSDQFRGPVPAADSRTCRSSRPQSPRCRTSERSRRAGSRWSRRSRSAAARSARSFSSQAEAAVLYDAPSNKAKPLFVLGRDMPVEVIVGVEGWFKIRDAGGTVAWIERKSARRPAHVDRAIAGRRGARGARSATRRSCSRPSRTSCSSSPTRHYATSTPGWAKVRHRDGQSGYVRIAQVWGL